MAASGVAAAGLGLQGGPLRSAFAATGTTSTGTAAPFTPENIFFNAHHAPIGSYSTYTIGYPGASGGFGSQIKLPAAQSSYIGVVKGGQLTCLPFFDATATPEVTAYAPAQVTRDFRVASDTFATSDFTFSLFSPVRSIPDPSGAAHPASGGSLLNISTSGTHPIEDVLLPSIFAEMVVDNTAGETTVFAVFGVQGGDASVLKAGAAAVAFGSGTVRTAIATDHADAFPIIAAGMSSAVTENAAAATATGSGATGSGDIGGIGVAVAPGTRSTIRFAIAFYSAGTVTTGRAMSFWYTRYYADLEAVVTAATTNLADRVASFAADNRLVDQSSLSNDRKFLLSQAVHSYYGNTSLLSDSTGEPWWVVMEGQYQYMNTFDLTVDQQFFELGMNPWTVRNVLDHSNTYYSYTDSVETGTGTTGAGGVAFTHDMGQWPNFSPSGTSAYEKPNVQGTFSFQTGEELTNWILIAGVYVGQTRDVQWFEQNLPVFEEILSSLANRDNPNPSLRDGIESYNSTKVGTGEEITTYDSIGPGLTEAVGNTYLGGKAWAAYVILEALLTLGGKLALAAEAFVQAGRAARTITAAATSSGYIASNVYNGESIPIIPVVEALVYPYFSGLTFAVAPNGLYGTYVQALGRHLDRVLEPGLCITADQGWQLDSQSQNTWLSKIFLNEFVGRQILKLDIQASTDLADAASVYWLTNTQSAQFAFSDQIIDQVAIGSEYYPRGVTSIVWLQETAS